MSRVHTRLSLPREIVPQAVRVARGPSRAKRMNAAHPRLKQTFLTKGHSDEPQNDGEPNAGKVTNFRESIGVDNRLDRYYSRFHKSNEKDTFLMLIRYSV